MSPLSFELGIDRQILLHQATHAAQSCRYDSLTPIGWKSPVSALIKREVQSILLIRYDNSQYINETEAFYLKGKRMLSLFFRKQ